MPRNFGSPFWRITFGGRLYGVEKWSINLSQMGIADAHPTAADAGAAGAAFATHLLPRMRDSAIIDTVKIARIGADGLYGDATAVTATLNGGFGQSGSGTGDRFPPQIALAVTLLGLNPRAAAGNGRFFLPAPATTMATDGRIPDSIALATAQATVGLVNALNDALPGNVGIVGPQTEKGRAPARQYVRGVKVGRILDTVRSRRSSFPEEHQTATTPALTGDFGGGGGDF